MIKTMISDKEKKFYDHIEKLIEEAEKNGTVDEIEIYEDIDIDEIIDEIDEDDFEEPAIEEGIAKVVYKKR